MKLHWVFAVLASAFLSGGAIAHGGGLNADGCHNDRRNGGYHCHRGPSSTAGQSNVPQLQMYRPLDSYRDGYNQGQERRQLEELRRAEVERIRAETAAIQAGVSQQAQEAAPARQEGMGVVYRCAAENGGIRYTNVPAIGCVVIAVGKGL